MHGPNKASKLPVKSLHDTTAYFRPGLNGSEL